MKRTWPIVAVVLALLILPFLLSHSEGTRLLFGWVTFIPSRLSRVTVNWGGVGMLLFCLALTVAFAHSFCAWLWRGSGRTEPWRPRWTLAGVAGVVLLFVSGMAITGLAHQVGWLMDGPALKERWRNANNALYSLDMIRYAQGHFQGQDLDDRKVQGYWRGDIAGLYSLKVKGQPIQLIDLPIAAADDRCKTEREPHATFSPLRGYVFRTLMHEDEKEPGPNWWAACAVPANPSASPLMLITSMNGGIYKKQFTGEAPAFFPRDPERAGWAKVDN